MKYAIVGKAASGKDWLQKKMVEKGYRKMKQYTTRAMRETETCDDYHFVSESEYKRFENRGDFISSNFYRIGWYGISMIEFICSDVAILSPANIKDMIKEYPRLMDNECTIIYLDIPVEVRRERLSKRYNKSIGDDNETRIAADENDFKDFITYNIRLTSVEEIDNFINNLPDKIN